MDKRKIKYQDMLDIFNAYIKEFNQHLMPELHHQNEDTHLGTLLKAQKQIIIKQLPSIKTQSKLALNIVKPIFQRQIDSLNQQKNYRISSILYTILGDIITLTATQVVCFGYDSKFFWMLSKQPNPNPECIEYDFEIVSVKATADIETKIANSIQFKMTDQDIKAALEYDGIYGFFNQNQQQNLIQASIIPITEFVDNNF